MYTYRVHASVVLTSGSSSYGLELRLETESKESRCASHESLEAVSSALTQNILKDIVARWTPARGPVPPSGLGVLHKCGSTSELYVGNIYQTTTIVCQ